MTSRIITYESRNAAPEKAWMAFIEHNGDRLGIYFTGADEEDVKGKVRAFWAAEKIRHEKRPPKKRAPKGDTE